MIDKPLYKIQVDFSKDPEEGKVAQHILGTQKFDAIISDIQMPEMDGIALLKWVKGLSRATASTVKRLSIALRSH